MLKTVKPLNKKIWRDIKQHPGQFIAVAAIIVCASALFIGMYSLLLNLQYSKQLFYRQYRFADIWVALERAPNTALTRVRQIEGIEQIRGRIVKDVPVDVEDNPHSGVGRVISMPAERVPVINDIHIVSGSYFTDAQERQVIINQRFGEENDLKIGDTIEATLEGVRETLTIVGTAYSPEYVYLLRSAEQFIPDDKNFGLLFVKDSFAERAFDMSGAFNDLSAVLAVDADTEQVLDRIESRLDHYGVHITYTREDQASHYILTEELVSIRGLALTIPLAFLIIAALILHIMLSRITEQQRAQIGTLIAIGYTRKSVAVHYLSHGAIVAITATIIGTVVGFFITGGMLILYAPFFRFPELVNRFHPHLSLAATALVMTACLGGVLYTVAKVVRIQPAQAMKPKAPPTAHAVSIERIEWLWSRLSLVWRTTIRSCLRVKSRSLLYLLGVAVSAVLLMVGLWVTDWMNYIMAYQFEMVDNADLTVEFRREKGLGAIGELRSMPQVQMAEGILTIGCELRKDWKKQNIGIQGLPENSTLRKIYDEQGRRMAVPKQGLVLPAYLMDKFGLTIGDTVVIEAFIKDKPVRASRVVGRSREYLGLTAYADRHYLARLVGESDMVNGALLSVPQHELLSVIEQLGDRPGVISAASRTRMIESFDEMLSEYILIMSGVITLMAALISFAVIYSISTINISERRREIASLLAMGWTPDEASGMVTAEIIPMAILGTAIGLPVGSLIPQWMAYVFDSEVFRVPTDISLEAYIQVAAVLMIFVIVSRIVCLHKAKKVNILEALSARE